MSNTIQFARGVSADFSPTAASANTLYFLTDTNQIFLGGEEFSKGVEELSSAPTADLIGEQGKLYIYNKTLYTYLNSSWSLLGFTEWTKLTGFPTDEDPHILAYQDVDTSVSPGVLIPLSKLKENLGIGSESDGEIADGSITPEKLDRQYLEKQRLWTTITTWDNLFSQVKNSSITSTEDKNGGTLYFILNISAELPSAYISPGLTMSRCLGWASSSSTIFIHSMNNGNLVWRILKRTTADSTKADYQVEEIGSDGVTYYYIIELQQIFNEQISDGSISPSKLDRSYNEVVYKATAPYDNQLMYYLIDYIDTNTTIICNIAGSLLPSFGETTGTLYDCSFRYDRMTTYSPSAYLTYNYYHFDTYIPTQGKHYNCCITKSIGESVEGDGWTGLTISYKDLAENKADYDKGTVYLPDLYAIPEGASTSTYMSGEYSLIGDMCYLNVSIVTMNGWGEMFWPLPVPVKSPTTNVITTYSTVGSSTGTDTAIDTFQVVLGVGWHPNYSGSTSVNNGILQVKAISGNLNGSTLQVSFAYQYQ